MKEVDVRKGAIIGVTLLLLVGTPGGAASFMLISPQVGEGGSLGPDQVISGCGCSGKNISPVVEWKDWTKGTKCFAVTVYDPGAPIGRGW